MSLTRAPGFGVTHPLYTLAGDPAFHWVTLLYILYSVMELSALFALCIFQPELFEYLCLQRFGLCSLVGSVLLPYQRCRPL